MNRIQNNSRSQYNNVGSIMALAVKLSAQFFVALTDILFIFTNTFSKQKYLLFDHMAIY